MLYCNKQKPPAPVKALLLVGVSAEHQHKHERYDNERRADLCIVDESLEAIHISSGHVLCLTVKKTCSQKIYMKNRVLTRGY